MDICKPGDKILYISGGNTIFVLLFVNEDNHACNY